MSDLPALEDILACPVDGTPLRREGGGWQSAAGRHYPEVHGVPVLLRPETDDTIAAMARSRRVNEDDGWQIDTLDMFEEHRVLLRKMIEAKKAPEIDPVVTWMIAATCGNLYLHLVGHLPRYPLPEFRMKNGAGRVLVDLGCNWGRWCFAAAKEGFAPIGIDPQLGAVLAAKRVAAQLGVKAHFICADARHLPLRDGVADVVFSYSVIQHLSRSAVADLIESTRRVLKPGGSFFTQMPNVAGLRCFYQWARRGFTDGEGFDVRYWTTRQLRVAFGVLGAVELETDCFFGIGLQAADADLMPWHARLLLRVSEVLRRVPALTSLADSVYVKAVKQA